MTIADWIQANSIWIAFVLIALVLVYYVIVAIEAFRKRTAIFVLLFGLLFIIWLAFNIWNIEPADQVQIMLLLALLAVTGIYANANVKMAEEMREQKYDGLRPVIDVQIIDVHRQIESQTPEARAVMDGDVSYELSFILQNIGLGPAIGVSSTSLTPMGGRWHWDFDTLAAGGKTKEISLSLKPVDGLLTLAVFYSDTYGRKFDSGRQVNLDKEKRDWEIGPLLLRSRENE